MVASVTALHIPEPKNHVPSGRPAWPRILLSGEEGGRKSWSLAQLSADERLGGMFWLEIGSGETTAEEYGRIPGVNYRVIEHDGTFTEILGQLWAHWKVAKAAEDAGEPPYALAIDSMAGLWTMLTTWVDLLARRREAAKSAKYNRAVRADLWSPEFIPQITPDLWNLANRRHEMVMEVVQNWPGPVGYTAREKQVTVFKDNGQPDPNQPKVWTLEAQKGLGFVSSAWIRLTRDSDPRVVKLRSASPGVIKIFQDSKDQPAPWDGEFSLASLVFDVIGCESGVSRAPEMKTLDADQVLPGEQVEPNVEPGQGQRKAAVPPRRPTKTKEEAASAGVTALLATANEKQAEKFLSIAADSIAKLVRIDGLLSNDVRDELKVTADARITLEQLADKVYAYVVENGYSVNEGVKLAAEQATEAS